MTYTITIIILLVSILVCVIFILFQLIDLRNNTNNIENIKQNYKADIDTYKQKVRDLLEENDITKQINNSLIKEIEQTRDELNKLESLYFEMEQDQALLLRNITPFKPKIL